MSSDARSWTGPVGERLRCCVCGEETAGADDYVLVQLSAARSTATQWLGAHASHLDSVLAPGFQVEVHLM